MKNKSKTMKKAMTVLLAGTVMATTITALTPQVGAASFCHTTCPLDHNHQTEVCQMDYQAHLADWENIPFVWEYNWDNAQNCWHWGMYYDGQPYTTPEPSFDMDVRNQIALYSDGEFLYLHVVQATINGPSGMNGYDFKFTVDGQVTQFQLVAENGGSLSQLSTPGTYPLVLKHENYALSSAVVSNSEAYAYVNESRHNSEFEVKFPLAALQEQNPNVDLDNINEISFFSHHLMMKPVTTTGISTFPYVLGGLCAAGVGLLAYRQGKKKKTAGV